MTGRDPAVEAARRALESVGLGIPQISLSDAAERGAREALAQIRELHRPFDRATAEYTLDDRVVCAHCLGPINWPCATARLAYSTEELEDR